MKPMRSLFFLCIITLFAAGCYYDKQPILYPSAPCNAAGSTYSAVVSPILTNRCNSCHNTANAGFNGGVNLDNYNSVKIYVDNGKLLGTINHAAGFKPMPKNGGPIPVCEIAKITDWVNSGAQKN